MIKRQIMLKEQKEQLSSFMDSNECQAEFVDVVAHNVELKQYWHRCHVMRDAMQGKLHDCSLTLDISSRVAEAIAFDDLYEQTMIEQSELPKPSNLFWVKMRDTIGKLSQVGLAACVTLAVIAGVQYQQTSSSDSPVLNTVPIGVNISPVGGGQVDYNRYPSQQQTKMDQQQYNKMRLLIQDYELQKRLDLQ